MSGSHSSGEERWMPVVGYEDVYEVSDWGRVRRSSASRCHPKGYVLKTNVDNAGYQQVSLTINHKKKSLRVHRLVWIAFNGPMPPGTQTNHIDGNKSNNLLSNLESATPSQNTKHAYRTGLNKAASGETNGHAKLTEAIILAIRNCKPYRGYQSDLSRQYHVTKSTIRSVLIGQTWKHVK